MSKTSLEITGDDFVASLSQDKLTARLEIMKDGEAIGLADCDSELLSTLIKQIGRLRAGMKNQVTHKLEPNPVFTDVTRDAVLHVNRQHKISKEFFIACRHPGFGWLAFAMSAEHGEILARMIDRQVDEMRPVILPKKGIIT